MVHEINSSRPEILPKKRLSLDQNTKRVKIGHHFKILHKKFEKYCTHCGYSWVARNEIVKQCPRCKRYFREDNKGGSLK
jgi:rubrerythrin